MRTIKVKIYGFDELSDKAKEVAKQQYAELDGYVHSDEAMKSIKALAEHFGGKVKSYEIDWFGGTYSSMDFDMPEGSTWEIEPLLKKLGSYSKETLKGDGDCVLTGYCMDEAAIDGFRIAWHAGERDLNRLMQAAFRTWLTECQADCEAFYENEYFAEHCEANGYEFYSNGKMYRKQQENARE